MRAKYDTIEGRMEVHEFRWELDWTSFDDGSNGLLNFTDFVKFVHALG